jgi:hypothetical protein
MKDRELLHISGTTAETIMEKWWKKRALGNLFIFSEKTGDEFFQDGDFFAYFFAGT